MCVPKGSFWKGEDVGRRQRQDEEGSCGFDFILPPALSDVLGITKGTSLILAQ